MLCLMLDSNNVSPKALDGLKSGVKRITFLLLEADSHTVLLKKCLDVKKLIAEVAEDRTKFRMQSLSKRQIFIKLTLPLFNFLLQLLDCRVFALVVLNEFMTLSLDCLYSVLVRILETLAVLKVHESLIMF